MIKPMKKTIDESYTKEEAALVIDAIEWFKTHECGAMTSVSIFSSNDKRVDQYKKLALISARMMLKYHDQFPSAVKA
jgi:hypothetical protein